MPLGRSVHDIPLVIMKMPMFLESVADALAHLHPVLADAPVKTRASTLTRLAA